MQKKVKSFMMLEFQDVSFRYPSDSYSMMEHLHFSVEEGSFVSIIGPSGCGKSTLFRLINGLEQPQSGQITVKGVPISKLKSYAGFMPQKDLLFPWRTVEENICLPMELQKADRAAKEEACKKVLQQVGLTGIEKKYPSELSGGMRQRVSFARTLLTGADMLLLDEPFSALDFFTRIEMQEWLLHQWEQMKKTILFITHDVEEALFLSKTVYVISKPCPFSSLERIDIPLAYPRDRSALEQPEIIHLKEELIQKLRKEAVE